MRTFEEFMQAMIAESKQPWAKEMLDESKDKWIQGAEKDIEKRGTKGVCTGKKFGSKSCPPGSKRYTLAQTFHKMAKKKKG